MPNTLQALLVVLLAILPGALYLWGFEREAGKWTVGLSDRLLRFVAASAIFQALFAYPAYRLYHEYVRDPVTLGGGQVGYVNRLEAGELPAWLAAVPVLYVLIPGLAGTLTGLSVRSSRAPARWVARVGAGRDPAPRAWDHLFAAKPAGTVRMRLKTDRSWVGGRFGEASYTAGYPEEPQDLLLEESYRLADDGSFARDDLGDFVSLESALLIRWDEVEFLEFFPTAPLR